MSKQQKRNYWKIAFWILLIVFLWSFISVGVLNKELKTTNIAFQECVEFAEEVYKLEAEGRSAVCEIGQTAYCS